MAAAMRNVFCQRIAVNLARSHLAQATKIASCVSTNNPRFMATTAKELTLSAKGEEISDAMKLYIKRLRSHEEFVEKATKEHELGKRHLANIMGEDPDSFTQEDVDKAIQYLLPSGLYHHGARPQMQHPDKFIPNTFVAQFDVYGRPLHSMFYTCKPAFNKFMYDCASVLVKLKELDDKNLKRDGPAPPDLFIADSSWIGKPKLEQMTKENILDTDFDKLMKILERIIKEPHAASEKELIMQFREKLGQASQTYDESKPPKYDERGRLYEEALGRRKSARAKVKVYSGGKGNVLINGESLIDFFPRMLDRQQLLFPLQFVEKMDTVDIVAEVEGGGPSGQAGAIRIALSLALQAFVSADMRTKMRLAGLLSHDPRRKERKKFGQFRARKKFTWKRR